MHNKKFLSAVLALSLTFGQCLPSFAGDFVSGNPENRMEYQISAVSGQGTAASKASSQKTGVYAPIYSGVECRPVPLSDGTFGLVKGQKWYTGKGATSSDESIIKINGKGVAVVKARGTAKVKTGTQTFSIRVIEPQLTEKKVNLQVGGQKKLMLITDGYEIDSVGWKTAWISANQNVVQVDDGMVTAVGPGKTFVYAIAGGKKFRASVKVQDTPGSTLVMNVSEGKSEKIAIKGAAKLSWTVSGDNAHAEKGKVTGVQKGNCMLAGSDGHKIKAYVEEKYSGDTSLTLDKNEKKLLMLPSHELAMWTSNNPSVASVSEYGVVIGTTTGKARLTSKIGGKRTKVEVVVTGDEYRTQEVTSSVSSGDLREIVLIDPVNGHNGKLLRIAKNGEYKVETVESDEKANNKSKNKVSENSTSSNSSNKNRDSEEQNKDEEASVSENSSSKDKADNKDSNIHPSQEQVSGNTSSVSENDKNREASPSENNIGGEERTASDNRAGEGNDSASSNSSGSGDSVSQDAPALSGNDSGEQGKSASGNSSADTGSSNSDNNLGGDSVPSENEEDGKRDSSAKNEDSNGTDSASANDTKNKENNALSEDSVSTNGTGQNNDSKNGTGQDNSDASSENSDSKADDSKGNVSDNNSIDNSDDGNSGSEEVPVDETKDEMDGGKSDDLNDDKESGNEQGASDSETDKEDSNKSESKNGIDDGDKVKEIDENKGSGSGDEGDPGSEGDEKPVEIIDENISYTVSFISDGGIVIPSQSVKSGNKAIKPETPKRAGYIFKGWKNEGNSFDFETPIVSDLSIEAVWAEMFVINERGYLTGLTEEGKALNEIEIPEFVDGIEIARISAGAFEGSKAKQVSIPEGMKAISPGAFNGFKNVDIIYNGFLDGFPWGAEDSFRVRTLYHVSIDLDGLGTIEVQNIEPEGKVAKPETRAREHYEFLNWYMNDEVYDFDSPVMGDYEIKAVYKAVPYSVSYDLVGGTNDGNPDTYTIESDFTLKEPKKTGYLFQGWVDMTNVEGGLSAETPDTDPVAVTRVTKGTTGNLSFRAVWKPIKYTVRFQPGDGASGSYPDMEMTYDVPAELPKNHFEKDGYMAYYWSDGSTSYRMGYEHKNLTTEHGAIVILTPNWLACGIGVGFKLEADGAVWKQEVFTFDQPYGSDLPTNATKAGYTFVGWFTEPTGGTQVTASTIVKTAHYHNLYAHWR